MPVIEAQCASILVPHDHRHINQMRMLLGAGRTCIFDQCEFCRSRLGGDLALGVIDCYGYMSRVSARAAQPFPVCAGDQRPAGAGGRSGAMALRL